MNEKYVTGLIVMRQSGEDDQSYAPVGSNEKVLYNDLLVYMKASMPFCRESRKAITVPMILCVQ